MIDTVCLLVPNPTVNEKKLEFTIRSPFNLVLELAQYKSLLRGLYSVRTALIEEKLLELKQLEILKQDPQY
jgi:hypothetical protein